MVATALCLRQIGPRGKTQTFADRIPKIFTTRAGTHRGLFAASVWATVESIALGYNCVLICNVNPLRAFIQLLKLSRFDLYGVVIISMVRVCLPMTNRSESVHNFQWKSSILHEKLQQIGFRLFYLFRGFDTDLINGFLNIFTIHSVALFVDGWYRASLRGFIPCSWHQAWNSLYRNCKKHFSSDIADFLISLILCVHLSLTMCNFHFRFIRGHLSRLAHFNSSFALRPLQLTFSCPFVGSSKWICIDFYSLRTDRTSDN